MSSFNWILFGNIVLLIIVLWFSVSKHKWKLDKLASIFTIFGVIVGTIALLFISSVYIKQKPEVKLSSFKIEDVKKEEYILDDNETKPFGAYVNLEYIYTRYLLISGYIINNGNAVASDLKFKYELLADVQTNENESKDKAFGDNIEIKVFENSISIKKTKISLIPKIVDDFCYSFSLPPINPDTSLCIELVYNLPSYNIKKSIEKTSLFSELLTENEHYLVENHKKYDILEKNIKIDDKHIKEIDKEIEEILDKKIPLQLLNNEESKTIDPQVLPGDKNINKIKTKIFIIHVGSIKVEDIVVLEELLEKESE